MSMLRTSYQSASGDPHEEIYQSIIFQVNGEVLWLRTPYHDVHPPHKRILPKRPKKKKEVGRVGVEKG